MADASTHSLIPLTEQSTNMAEALIKCINFAAIKHRNQRRNDKPQTPYINHPIGVAFILTNEAKIFDPIILQAALLHDTVEDTDTSLEEIEDYFGETIRRILEELTDDKSLPRDVRKHLQIVHAPTSSYESKLVKLADKLYNLRDIDKQVPLTWTSSRAEEYIKWSKQVVDGLRGTNKSLEDGLDNIFRKKGLL